MSDRHSTHNGRTLNGKFRVRQDDVDDKLADPEGARYIADEVRLGGAVEDTSAETAQRAADLQRRIDENRECVERFRHPDAGPTDHR